MRNKRTRRRRSMGRRLFKWGGLAVLGWVLLSLGLVATGRVLNPPASAVMLLEPGAFGQIDYRWVPRNDIARAVALAAIAAEDQRFLAHDGIDFNALAVAWRDYRRGESLRGASTISQQVAKNLFLWNGRSFVRKGLEAWFALWIDALWPKERVLEVYLNIAEFGPGVFGVEAASRRYFGQSAAVLTSAQAATLAAVLPNPKRYSVANPGDYVRNRREEIVRQIGLLDRRGHYVGLQW